MDDATTVADVLLARSTDDRPGLRCVDDDRSWTWREFVQECAVRASWMRETRARLRGAAGASRPLHLGVLFDNVPELLFLLGGAALSGSVIVALNTTRGAAELTADAARADCDLIVFDPVHAGVAGELATPGERLPADALPALLARHRGAEPVVQRGLGPGDLLMLIFTSGTSGNPRAVRVTHRKIVIPGLSLAGRLLTADDVVYCPMPLFHSGAIMAAYAPALVAGATLVLRRRFSASGLLPDVRRHGCTYLQYVGKALSYALATPGRPDDRDNPLKIAFGNEAAPREQKAFADRFGCLVIDAYGSTETAISLSPDPLGPPGSLGRLADGIKILNPETGAECPAGVLDGDGRLTNGEEAIGELVGTQGLGLFEGYYNDSEADAERLRGGMFWSGDFGYADENGYVFFTGRSLDRLRVDGENFGAAQVERVLAELPGIARLAVYGVPDVAAGDQVMLAVVLSEGTGSEATGSEATGTEGTGFEGTGGFDPEAFTGYLERRRDLGSKWAPRYVRVTRELPATASNKILKRRLASEGWHTTDPVWWRPGKDLTYRLMTPGDVTWLRGEFETRGRLHLLPGPFSAGGASAEHASAEHASVEHASGQHASAENLERNR
ncbi:AMP-binding protein [Actinomadura scrupuli]|uniref:AMP-binding protein n=1 Tax=Actinomadura scrupuli TaxID=559629 RepID=UPI003D96EB82